MSCRCRGRKVVTYLNRPQVAVQHCPSRKMGAPPMYLQSYDLHPVSLNLASESSLDGAYELFSEPSEWCLPLEPCQPLWSGEMDVRACVGTVPVYANENDSNSISSAHVIVLRREDDDEGNDISEEQGFVVHGGHKYSDEESDFFNLATHGWMDIRNAMAISFSSTFCHAY
eukprot:jgi/Picre1/31250/NNA_006604.t1